MLPRLEGEEGDGRGRSVPAKKKPPLNDAHHRGRGGRRAGRRRRHHGLPAPASPSPTPTARRATTKRKKEKKKDEKKERAGGHEEPRAGRRAGDQGRPRRRGVLHPAGYRREHAGRRRPPDLPEAEADLRTARRGDGRGARRRTCRACRTCSRPSCANCAPRTSPAARAATSCALEILRRVNLVIAPAKVNAVLIEEMLIN